MSFFNTLFVLSQYSLLVIPTIAVVLGAWLLGPGDTPEQARRRLLSLLGGAAICPLLLGLLIWTNPYGREISSSLPGWGVLPVAVALLALAISSPVRFARLWPADRITLAALAVLFIAGLALLWLAEPRTFYMVGGLALGLAAVLWLAAHAGFLLLAVLSLLCVGILVMTEGGDFYIPLLDYPGRQFPALWIAAGIASLATVFLAAALVYDSLRGEPALKISRLLPRWALAAFLLAGAAYMVFWEGIWSAAHARAFEDHLPFLQFLLALAAGVLLFVSLRGAKRVAGIIFVFLVTVITTLAFIWGWNVSAFRLTERRASRVNRAVVAYYDDFGFYPASLAELCPRYLLYLPPPVVVRQEGWCYQSGVGYYRLGYVSGQFTYFEARFHAEVYARVGDLPMERWACDALVEKFNNGSLIY